MKYNYFFTAAFSFFLMNGLIAQEAVSKEGEPQIIQTISVRKGQPQQVHDRSYYEKMITDLDELLMAIDIKIEHVQANEEHHNLAMENGWYEAMKKNKEEIHIQRREYVEKMKSFN